VPVLHADSESVRVVYKFAPGMGNAKKAVEAVRVEVNNTVHPITNVYLGVNDIAFAADFLKEAAAQELNLPIFGEMQWLWDHYYILKGCVVALT
jgi:hypothetical protein